ncbi:MAG: hypothetical protein U5P41_14635 [Gammaproteobacteria bacterium]|nr:hypothetical protein [Gammaproteobacteria bacterium]
MNTTTLAPRPITPDQQHHFRLDRQRLQQTLNRLDHDPDGQQ